MDCHRLSVGGHYHMPCEHGLAIIGKRRVARIAICALV
jgi:hypothetical protein